MMTFRMLAVLALLCAHVANAAYPDRPLRYVMGQAAGPTSPCAS
jgi:hypothetical protein